MQYKTCVYEGSSSFFFFRQVFKCFQTTAPELHCLCVYGGVSYMPQTNALRRGVDVVIGTPGRIGDLVERKSLDLSQLQYVVLDEVDRMLDMGFAADVENLISPAYSRGEYHLPAGTFLLIDTRWHHEWTPAGVAPREYHLERHFRSSIAVTLFSVIMSVKS